MNTIAAPAIPAKIRSNDCAKSVEFDASEWFATAAPEKILDLARSGWGGEPAARDIAGYAAASNGAVAEVIQYVMYLRHGGLCSGLDCFVNAVAGLEWLARNRHDVITILRKAA
jgi:hypothetical protein